MRGAVAIGIAYTTDILGNATSIEVSGGGRVDLVSYGIDFDLDAEMTTAFSTTPGCSRSKSADGRCPGKKRTGCGNT